MAKIIAFAHQKGGVGKTTLVGNLWGWLSQIEKEAVVMDTDSQGSLITLYDSFAGAGGGWDALKFIDYSEFTEAGYSFADLKNHSADFVLIDTAPYLSEAIKEIFAASDLVIIPTKTSGYDIAAIRSTIEIFEAVKANNPSLKGGIVLNMVRPSNFIKDIRLLLTSEYDLKVFKAEIKERIAFARTVITGPYVGEADDKAAADIAALGKEILDYLNN